MSRVARFAAGFALGAVVAGCVLGAWADSSPRPEEARLLVARERVTAGHVSIVGLPGWIYLPGGDGAQATWTLVGQNGQARARFSVGPLTEAVDALVAGTEAWRRSVMVGGLDATWIQFRPNAGSVVGLSLFDQDIGIALGTCLLAWAPEDEWTARAADFREMVSSISILDEELEAVVGTEADPPPHSWLAKLERLVPGPSIEGCVIRGARPVRRALVRLMSDAPPVTTGPTTRTDRPRFPLGGLTPGTSRPDRRVLGETVTDAHGVFRFDDVRAGWICVETPAGLGTTLRVRTVAPGPTSVRPRLVLQLGTGVLVGHAYDRTGSVPDDVMVRAAAEVHGIRREVDTRLEADGSFRFDGIAGGEWTIEARGGFGRGSPLDPAPEAVRMPWAGIRALALGSGAPEPLLIGRVRTRSGVGVPGPEFRLLVSQVLEEQARNALLAHARVPDPPLGSSLIVELDAAGCFEQRLPAGRYRVQLVGEAWDRAPVVEEVVLEPGGSRLIVTVPGVVVRGRVGPVGASIPTSLSAAGGWVTLSAASEADLTHRRNILRRNGAEPSVTVMAPLRHDGTFTLYGVPPGPGSVEMQSGNAVEVFRTSVAPLQVPEFSDVVGVELEVPWTATTAGPNEIARGPRGP